MIYAYLRVSTDAQDTENQRTGVDNKAAALGLRIDKYVIDDGISGTKEPEKRALGGLLSVLQNGDVIIVSELSRFGRRLFMLFRILESLLDKGVKVYSVKDGYTLDNSIQSKVLAFAFGMAAEIERDMIAKRTKEALNRKRANGIHIGRPKGGRNRFHKLDGNESIIRSGLISGKTKAAISRRLGVSVPTLNKFIRENQLYQQCLTHPGPCKHNKADRA